MFKVPGQMQKAIEAEILAGDKIAAIKLFREMEPAAGLAEAKEAVEEREANLRQTCPERFTRRKTSVATLVFTGIALLLGVLVLLGCIALIWRPK